MSKKTTILLFSFLSVLLFLIVGFFILRQVYSRLVDSLINQYAQEKLVLAQQTVITLEDEVQSLQKLFTKLVKIYTPTNGSLK